ncbi:hypothetical protein PAXRUDRAFT_34868 [Paxillus rubicundulus Ve08.2h10]|uniref:Uncharacterized protein n=1 Tax=Paxillus rubicundulus Ve08.2h10 TaxID=930991 RepID=A0A0D0DT48_9AGAM|nr:hypothetical protein PAXRUDRAFT_34868 [Paxillus rubicundulus Ve08.2h10]
MAPRNGKNAVLGQTNPKTSSTPANTPSVVTKRTTRNTNQVTSVLRVDAHSERYLISEEVTKHVIMAIAPQMATIMKAAERIESNMKEIEKTLDKANEQAVFSLTTPANTNPLSYSNTVKTMNAQFHPTVNTAWQVLMDTVEGKPLYGEEQTAVSIAKDIQRILASIKQDNTPKLNIKAITKLKNGGLVLESNSTASANDHHCPVYIQKCTLLDAKHPENSMLYFPTEETWTQVLLPPKPTPYCKPAPQPVQLDNSHNRTNFKQMMLEYRPSQNERWQIRHTLSATRGHLGTRVRFSPGPASLSNQIPIGSLWQCTITSYLNTQQNHTNTSSSPSTLSPPENNNNMIHSLTSSPSPSHE